MKRMNLKSTGGFTLVEILVSAFVFVMIAMAVYRSIASIYQVHETTDAKVVATELAGEQIEIIRNLPYSSVGIKSGLPVGVIDHVQSLSRSGYNFEVTTTVRSIDDPFDGVFPTDTVPADYKLVQMDIDCSNCKNFSTLTFTTNVGPKALETPTTSGALFIQAIDASGLPVAQADVHIVNSAASITIDDTTNNSGLLQIVSAPPGTNAYKVTVSKDGYSTETTYAPGTSGNTNPTKANPTVIQQQVTQLSFAIDRVSTINVSTVDNMCAVIPSIPFTIAGAKIIGTPNVLKFSKSTSTNASGLLALGNMEWDTYNATETSPTYDFAGSIPVLPLTITPGSTQDLKIILVTSTSSSAELVTVLDNATRLPVSGAIVTLTGATTTSLTTGRGFISQSSWIGGGGQETFSDKTKYSSALNTDTTSATNGMKLQNVFGTYLASSTLISSTFDTGDLSNFYQLSWSPQTQPAQTGASSTRFQIATNNDNSTWNFVGPDGTSGTYYSGNGGTISSVHNNMRYIRYKAYLQTANTAYTPNVSNVSITFTSACTPLGQVLFQALPAGTYTLSVSKSGYQTYTSTVNLSSGWQQSVVNLQI
jgi:hypothetical protein